MKRICLIIPSLLPGGMERVMSELAGYFCQNPEVEVHLILYGLDPTVFYPIPSNLVVHQPDWRFDNSKRMWHTMRRMWYLRKEVSLIKPETVLSFGEYWNNFALLALIGLKLNVFVSDRCQPDKSLGNLHDWLRKILYPRATGIIAQTLIAKEIYLKQYHHSNIHVIGNPIRRIESDFQVLSKEKIVLTVGRLIQTKHHDLLIDIFLKINRPDWKLVIVGGDALKESGTEHLNRMIKEKGAGNCVILTGNVSNVDEYYLKSSIFAFTSSSEGFPNVIGEAMSAELPVVAFDCCAGPSDIIEHGRNGFLIPLFDIEMFQNKLDLLMQDESLRNLMGKAAKESISHFSVDVIGRKYYEFITSNL